MTANTVYKVNLTTAELVVVIQAIKDIVKDSPKLADTFNLHALVHKLEHLPFEGVKHE